MKEGSIGPADMSLARLQRMSQHVRRRVIHLPEKFVKNANRVHVRGDLPKIVDEQIVHRSVASTTALRMIAVMRQLQGARRFVPLDHDFFNTMGLPRQVQEKVMEVLDVDGVGSLKRDQVRSIQRCFTHRPVSTLDRIPFQLTGELFLYGMALRSFGGSWRFTRSGGTSRGRWTAPRASSRRSTGSS
jgi:hypothetical protein